MHLSLQTFQQLLQRMSASVQSSASQLVDLSVGSMLRAILEANASIGLWIQWLIVQTLGMTRAATSVASDLDSWMADFMLIRQPATPAQGVVTFSRFLTSLPLTIPVGTIVKAPAPNLSYILTTDTGNAAWVPTESGYLLPTGISAIDLPVVAQAPGARGNVTAGVVSVIASSVPGLDLVSNRLALSGGSDAESDAKFRARFCDYINSRSQATAAAVGYAVSSIRQSMRYAQFANTDANGSWLPGKFLVIVDDGAGQTSASLLSEVYSAVERVRPIGSGFAIRPPDVVLVTVSITLAPGGEPLATDVQSAVIGAVSNYIEQLSIGPTLSVTRIVEVAYKTGYLIRNIAGVTINGLNADLICSPFAILRIQSVTVQ